MALERQNAQPEAVAVMKLIEVGVLSLAPEWTIYGNIRRVGCDMTQPNAADIKRGRHDQLRPDD